MSIDGACPICEAPVHYEADGWLRSTLKCPSCSSSVRERALMRALSQRLPDWRQLAMFEAAPMRHGLSAKLRQECAGYVWAHYYPAEPLGQMANGLRNENLEALTFADGSLDIIVNTDVMEHVNEPERVMCEAWRVLRPGGAYIFTTPTYKERVTSERRARYTPDGIVHLAPAEYHGNPVDQNGSLVTFHWGYDLPALIASWAPFDVTVVRFHDTTNGILGEMTEVYICDKR